jgi:hypothetical protein
LSRVCFRCVCRVAVGCVLLLGPVALQWLRGLGKRSVWRLTSEIGFIGRILEYNFYRLPFTPPPLWFAVSVLHQGAMLFGLVERIWKSWAPPKCRFFMWLVAHQRCWTTDRLAKCGLPHRDFCPLCDQEDENIQHLLVGCLCKRILVPTSAVCWSGGTHS